MKKFFTFLFVLIIGLGLYYYSTYNEYSNNLTNDQEIGLATDIYLLKFNSYPAFYSEYLFNKYEKHALENLAELSPKPYFKLMNFINAIENKEDIDRSYIERTYALEASLVCIGIDKNRIEEYKKHVSTLVRDEYFKRKYNSFNDDTVFENCKKAPNQ